LTAPSRKFCSVSFDPAPGSTPMLHEWIRPEALLHIVREGRLRLIGFAAAPRVRLSRHLKGYRLIRKRLRLPPR
jgi:hypothetical protein